MQYPWDTGYSGVPSVQQKETPEFNKYKAALKTVSDISLSDQEVDVVKSFTDNKALFDTAPDYAEQHTISNYRNNLSGALSDLAVNPSSGMTPAGAVGAFNELSDYISRDPTQATIRAGLEALNVPPEAEADYKIQQKLLELDKSSGMLDSALDFMGSMIPFRSRLDMADIGGEAVGNSQFEALVLAYRAEKDPAKRTEIATWMVDNIDSISDNRGLKQQYLQQMVGGGNPRDFVNKNTAFDALEFTPVGWGADVASLGKAVVRNNNIARRAVQGGSRETAGAVNAAALANKDIADATGTTTLSALLNTIGAKNEHLFPETVDGIADETLQAMAGRIGKNAKADQQKLVDELSKLDDTLKVSSLSDEDYASAIKAKKEELVQQYAEIVGPNIPRVTIDDIAEISRGGGSFELKVRINPSLGTNRTISEVMDGVDEVADTVAQSRTITTDGGVFRYDIKTRKAAMENMPDGAPMKANKTLFGKVDEVAKAVLSKPHRAVQDVENGVIKLYAKGENGKYSKEVSATINLSDEAVVGDTALGIGESVKGVIKGVKDHGVVKDIKDVLPPSQKAREYVATGRVTMDDYVGYHYEDIKTPGISANTVLSPMKVLQSLASKTGRTMDGLVERFTLSTAVEDRNSMILKNAYRNIMKNVSKKDYDEVSSLLMESTLHNNGEGRFIPLKELLERGKSESVILAYRNIQTLNEATANLRAWTRFKEWDMRGYKMLKLDNNMFNAAEMYSNKQGVTNIMNLWKKTNKTEGKDIKVWSPEHKSLMTEDQVRNLVDMGHYEMAWLKTDPLEIKNVGQVELMLVRKDAVSDLRYDADIFKTIDGYSPIIRPEAHYSVLERYKTVVNGVHVERKRIHTISPSLSMATKHMEDSIAEAAARGEKIELELFKPSDRGAKIVDDTEEGKLYYGNRAKHQWTQLAQAADMVDPLKAIGQNLHQVGKVLSLNHVRLEAAQRFKASVADLPGGPYTLSTPITGTSDKALKAEYVRKYIVAQLSVPDKTTATWTATARKVAEYVDGAKGNNAVSRTLLKAANVDPVSVIKNTAFHAMLGWFNPSQLFVQAMNMSITAAIHPIYTMKNAPKSMALLWAANKDGDVAIRAIAGKMGLDADEMADLHKQFLAAGIRDSIKSNADIEAGVHGFGHAMDGFKKLADSGLYFYRQGELSGRTVVYTVAREKYMNKVGKGWRDLDSADHAEIFNIFQDLSLNLSKANKSPFQYGVVSLPTQFWHVQTKYMELVFGKKLTFNEKMRMLAGQGMLFGAAGVPFGQSLAKYWTESMKGEDGSYQGSVDPDIIKQGMFGMFFGGELALADRAGLGNSVEDWYKLMLEDSNKTLVETALGASGTLWTRGSSAWKYSAAMTGAETDATPADLGKFMLAWLSVVSTANNATKAYEMSNMNARYNTKGDLLYTNPSLTEIRGKLLGIESQRYIDMYSAIGEHYSRQKWIDSKVDFAFNYWKQTTGDIPDGSLEKYNKFMQYVYATVASIDNDHDRNDIIKKLHERVMKPQNKEEWIHKQILKEDASSQISAMASGDAFKQMYQGGE